MAFAPSPIGSPSGHTGPAAKEAASTARKQNTTKRPKPKTVLRLSDLEQSKNAVLNSLPAASSQESYGHAIEEFIGWYCPDTRAAARNDDGYNVRNGFR